MAMASTSFGWVGRQGDREEGGREWWEGELELELEASWEGLFGRT